MHKHHPNAVRPSQRGSRIRMSAPMIIDPANRYVIERGLKLDIAVGQNLDAGFLQAASDLGSVRPVVVTQWF